MREQVDHFSHSSCKCFNSEETFHYGRNRQSSIENDSFQPDESANNKSVDDTFNDKGIEHQENRDDDDEDQEKDCFDHCSID